MPTPQREALGDEPPEGDYLDQERSELDEGFDPEVTASPSAPDSMTANDADVLEQAWEVPEEDGYPPA